MQSNSILAWAVSASALLLKYAVITSVQGARRFANRRFRWAEDAAHWNGTTASGAEDETVERCQAVLRNDAETQPFFLAFSAAWVALGAEARFAWPALGSYALLRCGHALLLVVPRQPWRNRAFVLGQIVLLGVVADVVRRAIG